jgi:hypothetical protein
MHEYDMMVKKKIEKTFSNKTTPIATIAASFLIAMLLSGLSLFPALWGIIIVVVLPTTTTTTSSSSTLIPAASASTLMPSDRSSRLPDPLVEEPEEPRIRGAVQPQTHITSVKDGSSGMTLSYGGHTTSDSITFTFEGQQLDQDKSGELKFECKLDTGTFESCSSPKTYTGLAKGIRHSFQVRAVDPSPSPNPEGLLEVQLDLMPANFGWSVDGAATGLPGRVIVLPPPPCAEDTDTITITVSAVNLLGEGPPCRHAGCPYQGGGWCVGCEVWNEADRALEIDLWMYATSDRRVSGPSLHVLDSVSLGTDSGYDTGLYRVVKQMIVPIAPDRDVYVSWGGTEEDWPDPNDRIRSFERTFTAAESHGEGYRAERLDIDGEAYDVGVYYTISCNR